MSPLETEIKKALSLTSLILVNMPSHKLEAITGIRDELASSFELATSDFDSLYDSIDAIMAYMEDLEYEIEGLPIKEWIEDRVEELSELVESIKELIYQE